MFRLSILNKRDNLNGTAVRYTIYLFYCKETHTDEHDFQLSGQLHAAYCNGPDELNCCLLLHSADFQTK